MFKIIDTILSASAKWLLALAVLIGIVFKARQSGKEAERRRQAMDNLRGARESAKIENVVNSADDIEYKRLLKKWTR